MGYVRISEIDGKYVPSSNQASSNQRYSKADESKIGAVARNAYKFAREGASVLGGLPGSLWNQLASLTNYAQEKAGPYLNVGSQQSGGGIPKIPRGATIPGIREDYMVPLGEKLFGTGSQEPQDGFIEGSIDKAAKWAPYTLGGAGLAAVKAGSFLSALPGLAGGLLTNLGQGAVGQGLKSIGASEGWQDAGEIAAGIGLPALGKLVTNSTKKATQLASRELKAAEAKAWTATDSAAAKAGITNADTFEKSILTAEKLMKDNVAKSNQFPIKGILQDGYNAIRKNEIGVDKLVSMSRKTNNALATINPKNGAGISILTGFKKSINKELVNKIGDVQLKSNAATIARKAFEKSAAYETFIKDASSVVDKSTAGKIADSLKYIVPIGSGVAGAIFRSPKTILTAIGIPIASKIAKNIMLIAKNPELRKMALKSLSKIGKKASIASTGRYLAKDKETEEKKPVFSYSRIA